MSFIRRRHLTLVMSLLLMIFSICQAQARVHLPAMPPGHDHAGMIMHDDATAPLSADYHDHCLNITAKPDTGSSVQRPDTSPMLLAWLSASPLPSPVLSAALAYRPPDSSTTDPPARLRFQRFLN